MQLGPKRVHKSCDEGSGRLFRKSPDGRCQRPVLLWIFLEHALKGAGHQSLF